MRSFTLRALSIRKSRSIERLFPKGPFFGRLLDDFDDAARARINQHGSIVDDRIAIFASTILRRDLIVGDACFRKYCTHPDIAFIPV